MSNLVNISEAASLGLHTMAVLAYDKKRRLTNQQIAELFSASSHHLAKVMQRLAKVGLVHSVRGPQGGFTIAKPAEDTTLLEIYEAIDGPIEGQICLFKEAVCEGDGCVLGHTIQSLHKQLRDCLEKTTLAELAVDVGEAHVPDLGTPKEPEPSST